MPLVSTSRAAPIPTGRGPRPGRLAAAGCQVLDEARLPLTPPGRETGLRPTGATPASPAGAGPAPAPRQALSSRRSAIAGFLLVVALAALPRVAGRDAFLTPDEVLWLGRTWAFAEAWRTGDWPATYQSGHPGVTTMWLGWLGLALAGLPEGSSSMAAFAAARLGPALACALATGLAFLLARHLWGSTAALLGALLIALDPFLVAHGRLLHLDALLASFIALALLAPLARGQGGPCSLLLLAGAATALALLTKAPALLLLPFVPLASLLSHALPSPSLAGGPARGLERLPASLPLLLLDLALWLVAVITVALVAWPALRTAPLATAGRVLQFAATVGGSPHEGANYFLGSPTADPGPLFYPVALALRLTPLTAIGLLVALFLALRWPRRAAPALLLLAAALALMVVLSLGPKKFDRYLLPAFPLLELVAAAALVESARRAAPQVRRLWIGLLAALGAVQLLALVLLHPHQLAYYNPLLGGGASARQLLLVGWGEGLDQAAAYLNSLPNADSLQVVSWYPEAMAPLLRGRALSTRDYSASRTDYVVLYVNEEQRELGGPLARQLALQPPAHEVRLNGITYARVYAVPRVAPVAETPLEAYFGAAIALVGFQLDAPRLEPGARLELTLHWRALAAPGRDYQAFAQLWDERGKVRAQRDRPAGGDSHPSRTWSAGTDAWESHRFSLPRDLTAGTYRLAVGLYRLDDGSRLPVRLALGAAGVEAGPDFLVLASFTLE